MTIHIHNISRIETKVTTGWSVNRYPLNGLTIIKPKIFTDKKYGGKVKSLKAAVSFRDEMIQKENDRIQNQDKLDAARYRFLRDHKRPEGFPPPDGYCWVAMISHKPGTIPEMTSAGKGAELDANIDMAMAAAEKLRGN